MSKWWWVAIATAVVLVAVVTLVPLRDGASGQVHVSEEALVDAGACADISLDAELAYANSVPLFNVFGISRVSTVLLSPTLEARSGSDCPADSIAAFAVVAAPGCDTTGAVDPDAWSEDDVYAYDKLCGDTGVALAAIPARDATSPGRVALVRRSWDGQIFDLGASGFTTADQYCFPAEYAVELRHREAEQVASEYREGEPVAANLCVPTA